MSILTRRWYFNRPSPVGVKVTKRIRKVLDFVACQLWVIFWHKEVRGQNATLRCGRGRQIKIKHFLFLAMTLHQSLIDDATWRRIAQPSRLALHKESLWDALVDNNNSYLRMFVLLVGHLNCSLQLGDFLRKQLSSLGIADSVSVDNEVSWKLTLVTLLKSFNCRNNQFLHFVLDNLLTLALDQIVAVVLRHFRIYAGCEADDGLRSRVTHIDSNQHSTYGVEHLWEL